MSIDALIQISIEEPELEEHYFIRHYKYCNILEDARGDGRTEEQRHRQ